MDIEKPKDWRKGQTIFNFLEWLHIKKGISANQSSRLADPFYIDDDKIDKYYEQYLEHCKDNGYEI